MMLNQQYLFACKFCMSYSKKPGQTFWKSIFHVAFEFSWMGHFSKVNFKHMESLHKHIDDLNSIDCNTDLIDFDFSSNAVN